MKWLNPPEVKRVPKEFCKKKGGVMKVGRLLAIGILVGLLVSLSAPFAFSAEEKPGKGLTFFMIAHPTPGHPFWTRVLKGAQDAANLLGVKLIWVWGREDSEYMISKIREAIAQHVDGMAISGIEPGALRDVIHEARAAGIPTIMYNIDDPGSERQAFIGQDIRLGGKMIAQYFVDHVKIPPEGGYVLFGSAAPECDYSLLREEGQAEVFKKYNITYTHPPLEYTHDLEIARKRLTAWLLGHPKPLGIFCCDAPGLEVIPDVLQDLGYAPGEIPVVGYDVSDKIVEAIKEGWILATVDQQQYTQGFFPIMDLYLTVKYKITPVSIDTGTFILTKDNIGEIEDLIEAGYR